MMDTLADGEGEFGQTLIEIAPCDEPAESTPQVWEPGQVLLDLYEVREVLGEGGFGTVYRVHHRGWDLDLAVKSLRPELAGNPGFSRLFQQECQAWINLGLHPHIVSCHYVRHMGGMPRIFSEYVAGGSLGQWLEQHPDPEFSVIVDLAWQCLCGLSHAHERGLIHRDVKPDNCLLSAPSEGTLLKLTDFGIAAALESCRPVESADNLPAGASLAPPPPPLRGGGPSRTLRFASGAVGTPAYMPPEQWSPEHGEIGPWSDIYAFGVMLFELCCGERPFDEGHETPDILKLRHLSAPPPDPRALRPTLPASLADFIVRCLSKQPQERFPSAAAASQALASIYESELGRPFPRQASAQLGLLAGSHNNRAVSLIDLGRPEEARSAWEEALQADPACLPALFNRNLTDWRTGQIDDLRVLEDFQRLECTLGESWEWNYLLGLIQLERGEMAAATRHLQRARPPQAVAEVSAALALAARYEGQGVRELSQVAVLPGIQGDFRGEVSPDGQRVLILGSYGEPRMHLCDLDSGEMLWNVPTRAFVRWACFVASGEQFWGADAHGAVHLFDTASGAPVRTLLPPPQNPREPDSLLLSPDQHWLLLSLRGGEHQLVEASTSRLIRLESLHPPAPARVCQVGWLGDSRRLAVCLREPDLPYRVLNVLDTATDAFLWPSGGKVSGGVFDSNLAVAGECVYGFEDCAVKIFDAGRGDILASHRLPKLRSGARIASDQGWLLVGRDQGAVLLDLKCGQSRSYPLVGTGWNSNQVLCLNPGGVSRILCRKVLPGQVREHFLASWSVTPCPQELRAALILSKVSSSAEIGERQAEQARWLTQAREAQASQEWTQVLTCVKQARQVEGFERGAEAFQLWQQMYLRAKPIGLRDAWIACTLPGHRGGVTRMEFSRRDNTLVVASKDGCLRFWELENGRCRRILGPQGFLESAPQGPLTIKHARGACLAPHFTNFWQDRDLRFLATEWSDFSSNPTELEVKVWDLERGVGHPFPVPRGQRFPGQALLRGPSPLILGQDNRSSGISIYDPHGGRLELGGNLRSNRKVVCPTPDERWLLAAGYGAGLELQSIVDGKTVWRVEDRSVTNLWVGAGMGFFLTEVEVPVPGATREYHYDVVVRDLSTGGELSRFRLQERAAQAVLAQERWLVSGNAGIDLWDVATGSHLRRFHQAQFGPVPFAFSVDGRWLAHGDSRAEEITVWALDWELEIPRGIPAHLWAWLDPFLVGKMARAGTLPTDRPARVEEMADYLTRQGSPTWAEGDFDEVLRQLGQAGLGWLPQDKVRQELQRLAARLS